jgi:tetratricopeptide (TPR) repeat protein
MTIRHAQGMFGLLPVRSNYTVPARDALLQRLEEDLGGIPLRTVRLTRETWDPGPMLADAVDELAGRGAIALLGLEETPGIVPAVGEENRRPPALAILNHAREAIRNRCSYPLVVWCDHLAYRALREHAPDFFDYFTGLFSFEAPEVAEAEGGRVIHLEVNSGLKLSSEVPSVLKAGASAALAFDEKQLARFPGRSPERAGALLGLAETLWALPDKDIRARLDRAETAVSDALAILSREDSPADWARGHSILGRIYTDKPRGSRRENLHQAINCFEKALQVYTESTSAAQWADVQIRLGIAYATLGVGRLTENLFRAIACYEAALRVFTEADYPSKWAGAQNNLGAAYALLPTGDRGESLRRAIACYEAALRVFTEADFPSDWAAAQHNLGAAYALLPTGDRGENFRRAIACFEAALRVYTEADFPSDWAWGQNNLGAAYALLPTGDRGENLRRAIACFEAALRVHTEADFPSDWARAQHNLGTAYAGLPTGDRGENLRRAIAHFTAALRVHAERGDSPRMMGTLKGLDSATRELARLDAAPTEDPSGQV